MLENENSTQPQNKPVPDGVVIITLETPIKRGTTEISEIKLRKPNAGELRGILAPDIPELRERGEGIEGGA